MIRYALLLGATEGETPLPMVKNDLHAICGHLMSPAGGAWKKEEIKMVCDVKKPFVETLIKKIKAYPPDFFFFYWSGHGGHNRLNDELELEVSPGEAILASVFYEIARKQILIFDTCRTFYNECVPGQEEFKTASIYEDADDFDFMRARRIYDAQVKKAPCGVECYFSSSLGFPSNATSYMSKFTRGIIKYCDELYKSDKLNNGEVIPLYKIVLYAMDYFGKSIDGGSQIPDWHIPKSNVLLPFLINI